MNAVQAIGSTYSYAQRYLVKMIFNLVLANEDNDGNGPGASQDQVLELNDLFDACKEAGRPVDIKKFLAWLNVPSLDQLTPVKFTQAVNWLKVKAGVK